MTELEKVKKELQKLLDYSLDVICTMDSRGRFLTVNAAAEKILGYPPDQLIGDTYLKYVFPEDEQMTKAIAADIMAGTKVTNFRNRCIHADGSVRPILWSGSWDQEEKVMHCIAKDNAEIEDTLSKLEESQAKLKTATRIAKLGYWQLQRDGSNRYWSDEVYEIWGVTKDTFVINFETFFNTIHPDDRDRFKAEQAAFYSCEKRFELEYRIVLPDQSVKWVYEIGDILKPANGGEPIFQGTVQDISHQKFLSLSLEKSNERFNYVSKATFDAIWDWNLETNELYLGDGYKELFGHNFPEETVDISKWSENIHLSDKKRILTNINEVINDKNQNNWIQEYRYIKADGEIAYVIDRGIVIRNAEGKGYRMVGAMQDISRRKKEELRLRLLESVITNTNDAVMISEANEAESAASPVLYVNQSFTTMTGYESAEVVGQTARILQGPKSDTNLLRQLGRALHRGESYEVTTINYKKSGEEFWINFSVSPVFGDNGKISHYVSIQRDITKQKNEEVQLKLFADDLYKRNQELQQFGYVVSHNLRAPVANIMGITTLLELEQHNAETVKACTANLKNSITRLDHVIRDLSQILSITDGSTNLTREDVRIQHIADAVITDLKENIETSGARIKINENGYVLCSHKAYLYSIFYNLISNGIKYRSGKEPLIELKTFESKESLMITVADNGIGIDLDKHGQDIFKPYKRFNTTIDGKGLGLFLVKSHVEALNGRITIESKPGEGTLFKIAFPLSHIAN